MITPTILYPQMKKWVASTNKRPALQCIYFSGEKAYATNNHCMAIVKNYPVKEAHYEYPEGHATNDKMPPEPVPYERGLVTEKDILWTFNANFGPFSFKDFIQPWKMAFDFIAKITKKRKYKDLILQKKGKQLFAYMVGNDKYLNCKFVLLKDLPDDGCDWEMGCNSANMLNIVDFLRVTEPDDVKMYINKAATVLTVETEDLILVTTAVRIKDREGNPAPECIDLVAFVNRENAVETANDEEENNAEENADEEDTDFLG